MNSGNRSTVGVRHSLATHLALRVVPPFFVLGILAIWLFRLSPGAAVLSTLLVLGMGGAFALMLRSQLATELGRLTGAMRQAQQGHLWVRADERGDDEIAELAGSFNAMLAHMTDLRVSQIETQREMASVQNELLLKAELESHKKEIEEANRHLEIRLRELSLLFDITRSINSTLELGELTKLITEMVGVTLGFQEFAMLLLDEETSELRVAATYGFPKQADVDAMRLHLGEGAAGRAAQRGEIVLVSDVSQEPDYLPYLGRPLAGSFLAVPLKFKGRVVGVLNFNRPTVGAFHGDEIKLLAAIANQAAMAIMNARLYQETVELSLTDPLTGIANRRHLFQRLEMELTRAQRFGNQLSLLMIDIDHFKLYNDRNGHPAGDEVLKGVAGVLRRAVRKIDTVARYGGEEFAVILPQIRREEAMLVGEKLRRAVSQLSFPDADSQPEGKVTVSIGLAQFPGDAQALHQLLVSADSALYSAKSQGRNRLVAFQEGPEKPVRKIAVEQLRRRSSGALRIVTPAAVPKA